MSTTPTTPPPPLVRMQHWDTRGFTPFLMKRIDTPFAWGTHDCCLFAADAIQAYTGVDIASDFRGKYTDEASAMALIKSVTGGSTVADAAAYCAQKHGLVEYQHPLYAKRGDLVLVLESGRLISGIVHLSGRHVAVVGASGLKKIPEHGKIPEIKRAWAV